MNSRLRAVATFTHTIAKFTRSDSSIPQRECVRSLWSHTLCLFGTFCENTPARVDMLTSVFKVHRFVAGGFGLFLLLAPDAMSAAMAPNRMMPTEERLTLQSWAGFMIAVALIVNAALSFPLAAQQAVARSLLACFCIESILYGKALVIDLADAPLDYKIGLAPLVPSSWRWPLHMPSPSCVQWQPRRV